VQRLRAQELQEQTAEKKRDEQFNKGKPMIPRLTWRKKHNSKGAVCSSDAARQLENEVCHSYTAANGSEIVVDSSDNGGHNLEGTAHDSASDDNYSEEDGKVSEGDDEYSDYDMAEDKIDNGNSEDAIDSGGKSLMDINMVIALPTKFRAPEPEIAELVLGPGRAMFEKPEKPNQHLKPLFIKGHIDGKPIGRMLVDGGAGVNIMPYSVFTKLDRKENELMKTNMGLTGFSGELSEARGIISMDLTVGSKTLPTAFFVVDVKGRYNVLLRRDWIHAKCCVPSTLHQ